MYIPPHFRMSDRDEMIALMRAYPFALLISAGPAATHLPFILREQEGKLLLLTHLAKGNAQLQDIEKQPVLVVFSGPHAYISPTLYQHSRNVPTWNYLAVHASGQARLISDAQDVMHMLSDLIDTYEPGFQPQWQQLPDDYRQANRMGIVGIAIEVTGLQGVKKLSQNKTAEERQRIADYLLQQSDSGQQALGRYMQDEIPNE